MVNAVLEETLENIAELDTWRSDPAPAQVSSLITSLKLYCMEKESSITKLEYRVTPSEIPVQTVIPGSGGVNWQTFPPQQPVKLTKIHMSFRPSDSSKSSSGPSRGDFSFEDFPPVLWTDVPRSAPVKLVQLERPVWTPSPEEVDTRIMRSAKLAARSQERVIQGMALRDADSSQSDVLCSRLLAVKGLETILGLALNRRLLHHPGDTPYVSFLFADVKFKLAFNVTISNIVCAAGCEDIDDQIFTHCVQTADPSPATRLFDVQILTLRYIVEDLAPVLSAILDLASQRCWSGAAKRNAV